MAPDTEHSPRDALARRRSNALLTGLGLAVAVAFSFLRALEDQLGRLQVPGRPAYGYDALHGAGASAALDLWQDAASRLLVFGTIDPGAIVQVHVAVDVVFALLLAAFLFLLVRRLDLPHWVLALVVAGASVDLAENLLELALVEEWLPTSTPFAGIFAWLGVLKLLPLVVAAIVVAVLVHRGRLGRVWGYYRRCSASSRLILAMAIVFALLLQSHDIGAQSEDLLRRELDLVGLVRAALFLGAYLLVLDTVRRIGIRADPPTPKSGWIAIGGAALVMIGWLPFQIRGQTTGLIVLGAIVLLVGVASKLVGGSDPGPLRELQADWLFLLAAVLPPVALAILGSRLLAGEVATDGDWELLIATVVALLVVAVAAGWWFDRQVTVTTSEQRTTLWQRLGSFSWPRTAGLVAVAVAVIALAVAQLLSSEISEGIGNFLGPFGVMLTALAGFAAAAGLVRLLFRDLGRPKVFHWLGMLRTPVVTLLVVWFVVVNVFTVRFETEDASPHVVRSIGRPATTTKRCAAPFDRNGGDEEVAAAFCRWLMVNAEARAGGQRSDEPVRLVLASASGGGVRAAAWTARVLDCLFLEPPSGDDPCGAGRVAERGADRWSQLFAIGGASGGSVGVASTLAHHLTKSTNARWIHEVATDDHVSRVTARMLLSELPLSLAGIAASHDRAEDLIDSWSESFKSPSRCPALAGQAIADVGFLALRDRCPEHVPLLMLNGTVVKSGKRFNIAPLDLNRDRPALVRFLCRNEDLPLFDAAFLSARFPFVTPSGHFTAWPDEDEHCGRTERSAVQVVDGGYAENSGAAQIAEVWRELRPMIDSYNAKRIGGDRPEVEALFLEIKNGEDKQPFGLVPVDTDLAATLGEPLKPPAALLAAKLKGVEAEALDNLEAQLERDGVDVVKQALFPHPGRRLPLGWALSHQIVDDMDRVFGLPENFCAAKVFRAYLRRTEPNRRVLCPQPR